MSASHQQEAPAGADRKLWIASGRGQRSLGRVHQDRETWAEFVKHLRDQQTILPVTKEEYGKFSLEQKAAIKTDLPWSLGARYDDTGRRKKENLLHRDTINIDVDKQTPEDYAAVEAKAQELGCARLHVSSASNDVKRLRSGRLIIPLSRSVTLDEFDAVSRKVAEHLGIESIDPVSHRPNQVCFAPACCSDATMVFEEHAGPPLDADGLLAQYADWREKKQRPRSSRELPDTEGGSSHLEILGKPRDTGELSTVHTALSRRSRHSAYHTTQHPTSGVGLRMVQQATAEPVSTRPQMTRPTMRIYITTINPASGRSATAAPTP